MLADELKNICNTLSLAKTTAAFQTAWEKRNETKKNLLKIHTTIKSEGALIKKNASKKKLFLNLLHKK